MQALGSEYLRSCFLCFLALHYVTISADAKIFLEKFWIFFAHKKLKKTPQKVAYLQPLGVFFSLQPQLPKSAQNFIFVINSFIRPSLQGSLYITQT